LASADVDAYNGLDCMDGFNENPFLQNGSLSLNRGRPSLSLEPAGPGSNHDSRVFFREKWKKTISDVARLIDSK